MKRYQTKPVALTVFRLNGPEEITEAIEHGERHGYTLAIEPKPLIETMNVNVYPQDGPGYGMFVDPKYQVLAWDEAEGVPHPWFVINITDLRSIYREVP